jgi:hypothetical protein
MFTRSTPEPTHLETVIDDGLSKLEETGIGTTDSAQIIDQLEKLHKMLPKKEPFVTFETLAPIIANVVGIVAILNYEKLNPITSKAIGFVTKIHV